MPTGIYKRKPKMQIDCTVCNKKYDISPYEVNRKCCSKECWLINHRNFVRPVETDEQVFKRFMANVKKTKECWNWTAGVDSSEYGMINVRKKSLKAHRYAYQYWKGKIEDGLQIDHICKNRRCVNPNHLECVTQTENIRRGVNTKLKINQVLEIKKLFDHMSFTDIGKKYGVARPTIADIYYGRSWFKDVDKVKKKILSQQYQIEELNYTPINKELEKELDRLL